MKWEKSYREVSNRGNNMNSYLLQGSGDPNLTFFDPFFWMVAMVNVCIGALPVMVSNTVVGWSNWVSSRLTCSLCTASSLSFSSSPTSVFLLWRVWISWKHECFWEVNDTHTNTRCVEEHKYRFDSISEAQKIRRSLTFLNSSIFLLFIILRFRWILVIYVNANLGAF